MDEGRERGMMEAGGREWGVGAWVGVGDRWLPVGAGPGTGGARVPSMHWPPVCQGAVQMNISWRWPCMKSCNSAQHCVSRRRKIQCDRPWQ